MDFLKIAEARRSVRAYQSTPVEERKLTQVLKAAVLAPTASNLQPFRLIVIHTHGKQAELRRIYDKDWFVQAPLIICACGVPAEAWVREDGTPFHQVDVAIVMDHLILAATEIGLGTCWVAAFDAQAARKLLGIPDVVEPLVMTPLGYPADEPPPKMRRPTADLVRYEHW
ncbi:MAG TPA: nitroreductase family protein [Anaerolineales bacterium]|nr:nitroreductase family protein [Anaerolineales bacterium]